MLLFLLGLLIGSVAGMIVMALFTAGKREDSLKNDIYSRT